MRVELTTTALSDLTSIASYIVRDNPERALTFVDELEDACFRLAENPERFPLVLRFEHLGIRRRVHGAYLIFYRILGERVQVLRVLNGAMDFEPLLFPNS